MPSCRRPPSYEPVRYDGSARIFSLRDSREITAPPEHLRAKPDPMADWIAAGLIASAFTAVAMSVWLLCLAFRWLGMLVGAL
jgi:hypothetical protein